MATTKTIQPTGETITIPAMTDRPDASVFATDVSRITDAVNSTNQALEIKQHLISASTTATITSVTALNNALEDSSMNTLAINASDRPTLVNAGLIPANLAGTWSVRKLSSGYMFMEYTTYNGHSYFTTINNGTLSEWYEVAQKSDVTFTNPGNGVFTSVVDSTYNNRLYIRENGTLAIIGGEFKAGSAIGTNAVVIATGCPNSMNNSLGQFTAINQSKKEAIQLDVTSTGELTTYYAGSTIEVGDTIRFQCTYPIR